MKELDHLQKMWASKIKRSTDLIVPEVTHEGLNGSLNNEYWFFNVKYAFREALDIKYEERKKNKKPYMVWTQGPILSFKEGDLIHSNDGQRAVQVQFANQMGWDSAKQQMYVGSVSYFEMSVSDGFFNKISEQSCTQMQFLQLLIYGAYSG